MSVRYIDGAPRENVTLWTKLGRQVVWDKKVSITLNERDRLNLNGTDYVAGLLVVRDRLRLTEGTDSFGDDLNAVHLVMGVFGDGFRVGRGNRCHQLVHASADLTHDVVVRFRSGIISAHGIANFQFMNHTRVAEIAQGVVDRRVRYFFAIVAKTVDYVGRSRVIGCVTNDVVHRSSLCCEMQLFQNHSPSRVVIIRLILDAERGECKIVQVRSHALNRQKNTVWMTRTVCEVCSRSYFSPYPIDRWRPHAIQILALIVVFLLKNQGCDQNHAQQEEILNCCRPCATLY